MKKLVGTVVFVVLLLGLVPAGHARVSLGIRIGPPPAPRVIRDRPQGQARTSFGWTDIGTRQAGAIAGMGVTGLVRRTREPSGLALATMAASFTRATGKATGADSSTITIGTAIVTMTTAGMIDTTMTATKPGCLKPNL